MRSIEEIKASIQECSVTGTQKQLDGFWLEWFRAVANGIEPDRLEAIFQAEREVRLVVLPCKVGSDVWLVLPDYTECSAHGEKYSEYSCAGCESECDSKQTQTIKRHKNVSLLGLGGWIASKCFGKTVFLTRAEAEAALAKEDTSCV